MDAVGNVIVFGKLIHQRPFALGILQPGLFQRSHMTQGQQGIQRTSLTLHLVIPHIVNMRFHNKDADSERCVPNHSFQGHHFFV